MQIDIVIPARFDSSRFLGKPLAPIDGIPMIKRVYDICIDATHERSMGVYVATDDERILKYCQAIGIDVLMTSKNCLTGTDRIWEVSNKLSSDIFINVQGDEPLLDPADIIKVYDRALETPNVVIMGAAKIKDLDDFENRAVPKLVFSVDGSLLYASRAPIPISKVGQPTQGHKQVCVYGFPRHALTIFGAYNNKTPLEEIEDIEILRFLELGVPVEVIELSSGSIAVDFPDDIFKVEKVLKDRQQECHG